MNNTTSKRTENVFSQWIEIFFYKIKLRGVVLLITRLKIIRYICNLLIFNFIS